MMARRRDGLLIRGFARATMEKADIAPYLVVVEAVEIMAGGDAALTTGTGVEIDGKCELLAFRRIARRKQGMVIFCLRRECIPIVQLRETLDGGKPLLLGEEIVDQGPRIGCGQGGHSLLEKMAWSEFRS